MKNVVMIVFAAFAISAAAHAKELNRAPITLKCELYVNEPDEKVTIERAVTIDPSIDAVELIYRQRSGEDVVTVVSNYKDANGDVILTGGVFLNNTSTGTSARKVTMKQFDSMVEGEIVFQANRGTTVLRCAK